MHYTQLTKYERYQMYILKKAGFTQKKIAEQLNRHPSTISREFRRNHGRRGYRPKQAHQFSENRRAQAVHNSKMTAEVKHWIEKLIRQDLSPEQACDYLKRHKNLSLHHETIYRFIYADKASGGDLYTHLRIASKSYRKRYGSYENRGKLTGRTSIAARPTLVDEKARVGDWEGDTVIGKGRKGVLLTMVERKTLYTVIVKLDGKQAKPLADAALRHLERFKHKIHTVTLDNGLEFAEHQRIARGLETDIYFADPYASWQRGINENTNGLIRQYFPKDMPLHSVTQKQIDFVMDRLNNRPRKTRGGKSPNELFKGLQVDLLAAKIDCTSDANPGDTKLKVLPNMWKK
jgi:transposase, IS30 family